MNRKIVAWFSLLGIVLTACQPIPPPPGDAAITPSTDTVTSATITNTVTLTETATLTATEAVSNTETLTMTDLLTDTTRATNTTTSTPSTPASTPPVTPTTPTSVAPAPLTSTPRGDATSVSPVACPALTGDTLDVVVLPNWQVGDRVSYTTEHNKIDFSGDNRVLTLAASTPVTFTVVSVEDDGYVLQLNYGQSQLGETDVELADPMAALLQTPLEVTIEYATDSEGAYLELLNLGDLQAQVIPLFDQFFDVMAETDPSATEEVIEAARGMIDRIVNDPVNFEALFTGDLQIFHSTYGIAFEDTEPLVLEDIRPNILGGAPIPSELIITPTHYDAELGCLRIEFENIADPVAARNSILEALQYQAQQMGVPGPREQDLPAELHLIDKIIFEIDLNDGWPTSIFTERSVTIADQGQVESNEYTLVAKEIGE